MNYHKRNETIARHEDDALNNYLDRPEPTTCDTCGHDSRHECECGQEISEVQCEDGLGLCEDCNMDD